MCADRGKDRRERVLIVRVGAMGDVLHALPAVAALRRAWPAATIEWVVDPRWAPLLIGTDDAGPEVSRVYLAETRLWSSAPFSVRTVRSVCALQRKLRATHATHVVDMQGTLRSAVLARFAGAPAGYRDPREPAAAWLYARKLPRAGVHVVEQGAALLGEAAGLSLQPVPAALPEQEAASAWAESLVVAAGARPIALLAPTAGWGAKQWPASSFGALAKQLAAEGWAVLVNAGSAGDPVCQQVVQASAGTASITVSTLPQLMALLRRTRVVVAGDTGPLHLAAALGTAVVGLYGPTDPARNGPWGPGPKTVLRHPDSHTSYKHVAAADVGLEQITVGDVLAAIAVVASRVSV